ncbi:MAG: pseudouridine synthase [Saezia sp.]
MNDQLETVNKTDVEKPAVNAAPAVDVEKNAPTEAKAKPARRTKDVSLAQGDKMSAPKKRAPRKSAVKQDRPLEAQLIKTEAAQAVGEVSAAHTDHDAANPSQQERRGRGLRGVVSRNRRKNVQKRDDFNPKTREKSFPQGKRLDDKDICFERIVSGHFDDDVPRERVQSKKRVLSPQLESPKLHKVLAQAGMGSRLEMEQLILEGRISVNSEPAHIGQRIQYGDQVRVNGRPIKVQIDPPVARVLAYHKPVGEIVTHDDPQDRPTVFRKLPRLPQGKWLSIGRLDINTEGLLLFTNSGDLANSLMHPRFGIEREYAVRVLGGLSDEDKDKLLDGVELDDGRAQFTAVVDGGGEGANQWYRVAISEGRNREVRRMVEACGKTVSRLIRIRYGAIVLPAGLKQGHWTELSEQELLDLSQLLGGKAKLLMGIEKPIHKGPGKSWDAKNKSGAPKNMRGRSGDRSSRNYSGEQPDPMRTSLGYIEHEAIIPALSGRGRNKTNTGSNNKRQSNNRGGRKPSSNY